jgi:hypothetical protein
VSEAGARADRRRLWREVGLTWFEVWRLLGRTNPLILLLVVLGIAALDEAASWFHEAIVVSYVMSHSLEKTTRMIFVSSEAVRLVLYILSTWFAYLAVFYGGPFRLSTGASIRPHAAVRLLVQAALRWLVIIVGASMLKPAVNSLLRLVWIKFHSAPDVVTQVIVITVIAALVESALVALVLWRLPAAIVSNDSHSYTRHGLSILFVSCFLLFETTALTNEVLFLVWHILSWRTGSITTSLNSGVAVLLTFATYQRMQVNDPSVAHVFD